MATAHKRNAVARPKRLPSKALPRFVEDLDHDPAMGNEKNFAGLADFTKYLPVRMGSGKKSGGKVDDTCLQHCFGRREKSGCVGVRILTDDGVSRIASRDTSNLAHELSPSVFADCKLSQMGQRARPVIAAWYSFVNAMLKSSLWHSIGHWAGCAQFFTFCLQRIIDEEY